VKRSSGKEPDIEELTDLVGVTARVLRGGDDLRAWVKTLIRSMLDQKTLHISGGLIVPQMGDKAGLPLQFIASRSSIPKCYDQKSIRALLRYFWDSRETTTQIHKVMCTHSKQHLSCVIVPISAWFDRPIGYYYSIAEEEEPKQVAIIASQMNQAASLVALAIRSEKSCAAISALAKPAWLSESTTVRTVTDVTESFLNALSCLAVIVWKTDSRGKMLHTLVTTGNAGANLKVDMPIGKGAAGKCAGNNCVLVIDDLLDKGELSSYGIQNIAHSQVVKDYGWRSALFVPLDIGGETVGVLAAYAGRPRGFSQLDKDITLAFAQRLCAGYVHVRRLEELTEVDRRISLELPAMEAGMLAMERVHDVDNQLTLAQNQLSIISTRFRDKKSHETYKNTIAASEHLDRAHKTIKALVPKQAYCDFFSGPRGADFFGAAGFRQPRMA